MDPDLILWTIFGAGVAVVIYGTGYRAGLKAGRTERKTFDHLVRLKE